MSNNICFLDGFPIEIIHMIFDYLSICDILHGLFQISSYIDQIIFNFNYYQINFRSIRKNDFDLICHHLKGRNMISLILSDGIDTPNQSQLFFSLFQLEDFSMNLRSLTLEDIDNQSMQFILNHLDQLNHLKRLTIINNQLISSLSLSLKNVLPRLIQLSLSSEWFFLNVTLMNELQYLILSTRCTYQQLEELFHHAPNLLSLNISLERNNEEAIPSLKTNLTRLVLDMTLNQMNRNHLEDFLNCFPCLTYLEIECRSDLDLCDGYQWEIFLQNHLCYLKRFHFKFQLRSTIILNSLIIEKILQSFSSSYWLNEKQWFIAIESNQRLIYSIPKFVSQSADSNYRSPSHCTTSDQSIFYNQINALALWGHTTNRFPNIKELWLVDDRLTDNLELIIDFNRVERLIFVSSKSDLSLKTFIYLIENMSHLKSIQFSHIPLSFERFDPVITFKQIRSLIILREFKSLFLIEIFMKIFPQLECLQMKMKTNQHLEEIFRYLPQTLSMVQFHWDLSNLLIDHKYLRHLLGHSNFTFRLDRNSIALWMTFEQSRDEIEIEQRPKTGCFSWCSSRKLFFKR